ncbi:MAG: hypothetical protein M0036_12380 [Desulfobacteraceae bacterium]|nr:hypothetical protein [Desulfobacteraceae bacterium]
MMKIETRIAKVETLLQLDRPLDGSMAIAKLLVEMGVLSKNIDLEKKAREIATSSNGRLSTSMQQKLDIIYGDQ